ncbi:lipopolysaccharide heptosyltransferase I [Afipia felis]|uniref:Lipopolysaccharide heptosyltransferase 1 n=2 Tax=Afipia felis TaxID=1035 RepID=A0A380W5Q7_AFIFE|nr:lipopolysaccharide heptosyltransferase I [Afipia felis]EKS27504.1 lipopolysaccharide heptosyltransferase I [Afipia felis ATCC 53690]SUU76214.1 Lipopolysaccharide heptosyltransferase 1 [Afipia felis]SUU84281.1 Lipopolysaccharide heptosyltransferase 1 [Afipia felis]
MTTVLVVKTSSLGDVVHQMPAMTDARRNRPNVRLVWVVEEAFAPLARLHRGVADVIPVATRRWRSQLLSSATWEEVGDFRMRLRDAGPEAVIDTQGLLRSALIARATPGKRHGYDWSSIREPLASLFYDVKHSVSRAQHAVVRNRALTGLSLGYTPDGAPDYGLVRPPAAEGARYAVLLHGTSKATKEWRESEWIGLGKWLHQQGLEVVLPWGSERERLRCQRLAGGIPGSRILDRQPLDATAKVIANAALVVGVDTGLLHLAAAYGVPLLAVFLATDPGLTGPVGSGPIVILGGKGAQPAFGEAIRAVESNGLLPVQA